MRLLPRSSVLPASARLRSPLATKLAVGILALSLGAGTAWSQTVATPTADAAASLHVSDAMWTAARAGQGENAVLAPARTAGDGTALSSLRVNAATVETNLTKREELRQTELARVNKELDESLALEPNAVNLGKSLKSAVELYVFATDKPAVIRQQKIQDLVRKSDAAAHIAEAEGDWLAASTLYGRLHILLEEQATYKGDIRRIGDRLGMIRLYTPQKLWELRNKSRIQEKLKELPPYNALGDGYETKLSKISAGQVYTAILSASDRHVEGKGLRPLLIGSLESVRTMATTTDLKSAFPGLGDDAKRSQFVAFLDSKIGDMKNAKVEPDRTDLEMLLNEVPRAAKETVQLPENAVLHEFGNGGFDRLDEFSQIIWPDEFARFQRLMTGQFIGVGIQIQLDDETQMIKVISPLEGTPAFKGGIKSGDFIRRIDGKDAIGMTIDQAVENITGKSGTKVQLTMEREGKEVPFELRRESIPLRTAKGWKREGAKDDDWNWFIDPEHKIGYIRLTGFQGTTTNELRRALSQMEEKGGYNGLILDLRFNPGGLLDQAVSVTNTFVNDGMVVYTKNGDGRVRDQHFATRGAARTGKTPIVVLINEGSASASEIVSGAMKYYADQGKIDCVLVGARSFGKGSVQTVENLGPAAMMKLTQQYYYLPDDRLIHRRDHATEWGVEPHLKVEMLPKEITDSLTLRQDADLSPELVQQKEGKPAPDPQRLLSEPLDLQLQTALVLLQSKAVSKQLAQK